MCRPVRVSGWSPKKRRERRGEESQPWQESRSTSLHNIVGFGTLLPSFFDLRIPLARNRMILSVLLASFPPRSQSELLAAWKCWLKQQLRLSPRGIQGSGSAGRCV